MISVFPVGRGIWSFRRGFIGLTMPPNWGFMEFYIFCNFRYCVEGFICGLFIYMWLG